MSGLPAQDGRPWTSIIASGVVREWGALVVLAGVVAYLMFAGHERDKMVLEMMGAQAKRHGAQMDRAQTILADQLVEEVRRQAANQEKIINHLVQVISAQENLLPLVNRLLQIDRFIQDAAPRQHSQAFGQPQPFPGATQSKPPRPNPGR